MATSDMKLCEKEMRRMVLKDSDARLRNELINFQTHFQQEQVEQMTRSQLVGYICSMRLSCGSYNSCKTVVHNFNPALAIFNSDDDKSVTRSGSLSDVTSLNVGEANRLVVSQTQTQQIPSTSVSLAGPVFSLELYLQLQDQKDKADQRGKRKKGQRV